MPWIPHVMVVDGETRVLDSLIPSFLPTISVVAWVRIRPWGGC